MVESIDPSNLLDFSLAVAQWSLRSPDTLEDELGDVLKSINTFADNQQSDVFAAVSAISTVCINAIIETLHRMSESSIEVESETESDESEIQED